MTIRTNACMWLLLAAGCSAAHEPEMLDDAPLFDDARTPVAGDSDDGAQTGDAPAPLVEVVIAADPEKRVEAVCGGLSLAPFDAAGRTDRGPEGLGVLRAEASAALDTFAALRAEHADSYTFVVIRSSFVGWRALTTLTVRAGEVVRREQHVTYEYPVEGLSLEDFVEEGDAVGTHGGTQPPITLPELYAPCLERTLCSDPARYDLYLSTDAQGVLLTCGNFPRGCYDDCYQGFRLESVTFE